MPIIAKVNNARNIKMSIKYARNGKDQKGNSKLYDSIGINCNPENAENDFEATNFVNRWSSRNHIQLKKLVLGFGPLNKNTLSAQEAHVYTECLLNKYNKLLGGGWRIAAYAHKDHPQSFHYHVLICNCNMRSGKKLTTTYKDVRKLRSLNDNVSHSFGIKPVQRTRLVAKGMEEMKGQEKAQKNNKSRYSYQDHVRVLMSKAMLKAHNIEEFKQILKHNSANLKSNFLNKKLKIGTIIIPSIQPNGNYNHDKEGHRTKRKVRTNRLGLAFDKSNILNQLSKPISKRSDKYMSVYHKYSRTPNSVILSHIATTPFMNMSHTKDKTSDEYLNSPVVRNNFKTKGEINREKQFKLIRTIQELNKKFADKKPSSKQSSNAKGRSIARASSINQQAKRNLNSIKKSRRRLEDSNNRFAKSIINQPQIQLSASRREQKSDAGQSEIKGQKQSINQSSSIIQRCQATIRQFRKREWSRTLRYIKEFKKSINKRRQSFENISQKFTDTLSRFRDSNLYLSSRKKGQFVKADKIKKSIGKSKLVILHRLFKGFKDNWLSRNQLLHKFHDEHYNYIQHKRGYSYIRVNQHGETNLQTFYRNLSPKLQVYMLSLTSLGDSDVNKPNSDFIKLSKFYFNQKRVHPNMTYKGISSMPLSNQSHVLLKTIQNNSKQLNIHDSSLVDDVVLDMYYTENMLGNNWHHSNSISNDSDSSLSSYNNQHGLHLQYNYSNNSNSKQRPVKKIVPHTKKFYSNTNQVTNVNRQRKSLEDNNKKKGRVIRHHGPTMHM